MAGIEIAPASGQRPTYPGAPPTEGASVEGKPGFAECQLFCYQGTGAASKTITLQHRMGWIYNVFALLEKEGKPPLKPAALTSYETHNEEECYVTIGKVEKGDYLWVVLFGPGSLSGGILEL
jgi:hypothetical protein